MIIIWTLNHIVTSSVDRAICRSKVIIISPIVIELQRNCPCSVPARFSIRRVMSTRQTRLGSFLSSRPSAETGQERSTPCFPFTVLILCKCYANCITKLVNPASILGFSSPNHAAGLIILPLFRRHTESKLSKLIRSRFICSLSKNRKDFNSLSIILIHPGHDPSVEHEQKILSLTRSKASKSYLK